MGEKKDDLSVLGYDTKHATERALYCKDVKRISDKKIHEAGVLERQNAERLEAIRSEQQKKQALRFEQEVILINPRNNRMKKKD